MVQRRTVAVSQCQSVKVSQQITISGQPSVSSTEPKQAVEEWEDEGNNRRSRYPFIRQVSTNHTATLIDSHEMKMVSIEIFL